MTKREYSREYYRANIPYFRRYYMENRERFLENGRRYYAAHREEMKQKNRERTARIIRAGGIEVNPSTAPPEMVALAQSIRELKRAIKETPK
jgi:hypothetical protein